VLCVLPVVYKARGRELCMDFCLMAPIQKHKKTAHVNYKHMTVGLNLHFFSDVSYCVYTMYA